MTKTKERETLERLAACVVKQRRLKADNQELFEKLKKLEREEKLLSDLFKESARERAIEGESVIIYDDEIATVMVVSGVSAPTYDVEKAKDAWPRGLLMRVIAIDAKKLNTLVEEGSVSRAMADEAAVPGKPLTPAVRIEIHGGKT